MFRDTCTTWPFMAVFAPNLELEAVNSDHVMFHTSSVMIDRIMLGHIFWGGKI